ncbi:MAG: hypothetical protein IPL26_21445 [Leptospiraceae bacterium]|nr:hypothetical protein [Leptospiraceae bacterium]
MRFIIPISYFENDGSSKILEVDIRKQNSLIRLEYTPEIQKILPSKGFTRIDWSSNRKLFYVSGFNEILLLEPKKFQIKEIWHSPDMNDVHDLKVYDKKIYIVNTGKESIDIYTDLGYFISSIQFHSHLVNEKRLKGMNIDCDDLDSRQSIKSPNNISITESNLNDSYYTKKESTSPFHQRKIKDCYHINHICKTKYQTLVTMFMQKQIFDLNSMEVVISNLKSHPHDGFIFQDEFWITCVDGNIFCYKIINGLVTNQLKYHYDIFALTGHTGWCRGLWVTRDYLIIGLTQIQIGKMPESRWSGYPVEKTETAILLFDRKTEKLLSFVDLSCKEGSKVFGFYPEVTNE